MDRADVSRWVKGQPLRYEETFSWETETDAPRTRRYYFFFGGGGADWQLLKQLIVTFVFWICFIFDKAPWPILHGLSFMFRAISFYFIYFFESFFFFFTLQYCIGFPIDGSPPGSSVPGILQARVLKWVAIAFSDVS